MSEQIEKQKCEASSNGYVCNNKARFKIIDIVCDINNTSAFWVCDKCIKFFIKRNEDNPHYIILKDKKEVIGK